MLPPGPHPIEIRTYLTAVRALACLWALLGLSLCTPSARAQYRFDHWTADNGLPQNSVRDIVQTRDGYLWLATLDGLVRFDGVRFTVFNKSNSPGIISNRFLQLYEDGQGDLWASTDRSDLTRRHQGRFTTYTTADGLPDYAISSIGGDGQGNLLMFFGLRLIRWIDDKFQPADDLRLTGTPLPSDMAQHPPGFMTAGQAVFFVGGQLHRWTTGTDLQFRLRTPAQDHKGNPWFGSPTGLLRFENGRAVRIQQRDGLPDAQAQFVYGQTPTLQAFSRKKDGSLWLTDLDSMQSQLVTQESPEGLDIFMAYADREGNYWFGTWLNGLYRARRQAVTPYTKAQDLMASEVYPILEDRAGTIWIGSIGDGLFHYQNGVFSQLPDSSRLQTSLFEDRAGRIWANGQQQYVDGRLGRGPTPEALPPEISNCWTMYEDQEGAFWFGTERGAVRYKDGVRTYFTIKDGLAGDDVKVIIGDGAGGLWLGSYGGLTKFSDGRFTAWTETHGLPGNNVRALRQDSDGALWIGTYDSGLGRFKDGRFTHYTTKEGLFDNGVFQILEDDFGRVWMSCNRGIYRVRKQELNEFAEGKIKTITSVAFGKSDGMENVECNGGRWPAGIKAHDGKLWFPTMGGVVVIDPATITTNAQPPPVVLEDLKIDNRSVALETWEAALGGPRSAIEIKPGQENFEIEYTALSFINSANLRFKYRLEGLDQDWVEAGTRRTAYYSYVPPGAYTFTVIAANSDGVWNKEGKSVRITVLPPFYRTWWFLTLVTLAAGGAVFAAFKSRVAQIERRQALQQAFARQLLESQEGERKRIAAELHDSLSQNLLVIKNRAQLRALTLRDEQARTQFTEFSDAISQTLDEVRAISYDLRPSHLDQLGLRTALVAMIEKVSASSTIQFTYAVDDLDGLLQPGDEIMLYRIVQECLNNILKHSGATKVALTLAVHPGELALTIHDNGRGFTPEDIHQRAGLGLQGIRERARILGGTHAIESAPGQGTTVTLRIALKDKQR
ncbi:MAG TPA: two-component regulator propeller domain-containing protein [Blastocatellia bacterium]|nr:two-component regulator propeller domain-containing protein [Blastocatellia bacterium]